MGALPKLRDPAAAAAAQLPLLTTPLCTRCRPGFAVVAGRQEGTSSVQRPKRASQASTLQSLLESRRPRCASALHHILYSRTDSKQQQQQVSHEASQQQTEGLGLLCRMRYCGFL
jgi:hypothetical protein